VRPLDGPVDARTSGSGGRRQDYADEARRLLFLVASRPLVLSLAVGLGIAANDTLSVRGREAGAAVLLACYALTGAYVALWRLRANKTFQLVTQVVLDAALVTFLTAVTGGPGSQYVLLYLLLILYVSLFASFRGALAAGLLCAGSYAAVWSSPLAQLYDTSAVVAVRADGYGAMLFYGALFVAVGALSGFLARRIEQKDKKLHDTAMELERIQLGTDVIFESMGSGIMSIDSEGRVVHFNRTASQILGLEPAAVKNRHYEEILGGGMSGLAEQLKIGLEQNVAVFRGETEITSASGRLIPLGVNTSLVVTDSGRKAGVVALYQDLTEAKKLDEQVKRQETLAALGAFSAGIAHEIRNCVSPIAGSAELLSKEVSLKGDAQRLMGLILKEIDRLDVFLNELLFYARSKPAEIKAVDLHNLITETVDLVKQHPAYRDGKTVACSFRESETVVQVDSEQLKRVFVNLAVNALEALECGGELTIRTFCERDARDSRDGRVSFVVVEFSDNGVGIPPETLHRVMEPFYSTKGSGTGLGLSIAQRVVERHNGRLSIESRLGMGTKVRVHIPCAAADNLNTPCPLEKAA